MKVAVDASSSILRTQIDKNPYMGLLTRPQNSSDLNNKHTFVHTSLTARPHLMEFGFVCFAIAKLIIKTDDMQCVDSC